MSYSSPIDIIKQNIRHFQATSQERRKAADAAMEAATQAEEQIKIWEDALNKLEKK